MYLEKNNILASPNCSKLQLKVKYFTLLICLAVHNSITAQSADTPPPPPPPNSPPYPEGSIDGGLVFLLIAGVLLGVYFLVQARRKATN